MGPARGLRSPWSPGKPAGSQNELFPHQLKLWILVYAGGRGVVVPAPDRHRQETTWRPWRSEKKGRPRPTPLCITAHDRPLMNIGTTSSLTHELSATEVGPQIGRRLPRQSKPPDRGRPNDSATYINMERLGTSFSELHRLSTSATPCPAPIRPWRPTWR